MGRPSKLRIIPRPHPANASAPKRSAGDGATPMLRQLRTKFIALNMALAALVLAASFATICYADYRADIDDVRNRLMAATSRSLHEPQLIPDAEPFHRGEGPREGDENAPDGGNTEDDGAASTTGQPATLRRATRKTPRAATQAQAKVRKAARPPPPPRTSAPARVIPASRRPASAARAPPRRHRCPWRSTISPTARLCS